MKSKLFKKILTLGMTALLALPLALTATKTATTKADTTPSEQTIVLTKYGFEQGKTPEAIDRPTNVAPDNSNEFTNAKPLEGVSFDIYDVTAKYWSSPKDYHGDYQGLTALASGVTDAQGQITKSLPTISDDKAAVYLFHETNPRAGYDTSKDFWLSLPAKAAADGNVYVYPKNTQHTTYDITFVKKDAVTGQPIAGAGFKIKNEAGKYLQLTDKDGKALTTLPAGYIDVLANNYRITWVADGGNEFTTDTDGKFGLNGFTDNTATYTWEETTVPDGYDKATITDDLNKDQYGNGNFTTNNETDDILEQPTGLLPHTGGRGMLLSVIAGLVLLVIGGTIYLKRRHVQA